MLYKNKRGDNFEKSNKVHYEAKKSLCIIASIRDSNNKVKPGYSLFLRCYFWRNNYCCSNRNVVPVVYLGHI